MKATRKKWQKYFQCPVHRIIWLHELQTIFPMFLSVRAFYLFHLPFGLYKCNNNSFLCLLFVFTFAVAEVVCFCFNLRCRSAVGRWPRL